MQEKEGIEKRHTQNQNKTEKGLVFLSEEMGVLPLQRAFGASEEHCSINTLCRPLLTTITSSQPRNKTHYHINKATLNCLQVMQYLGFQL